MLLYSAARDRREAEPHPRRGTFFVKGLHVVGHGTVTPQCSEVPDCGLLMSSGVSNPKFTLKANRKSCPAISDAASSQRFCAPGARSGVRSHTSQ